MTARDRWIDRHLRRLHFGQFLQRAVEWLTVYLFCFGTTVLVVKLTAPTLWPNVLWVGVGAVPVTLLAWWTSRTGQFTRGESVALLDRSLGAGGLLMTLTEAPDEDWETHLPQVEQRWRESLPRIRAKRFASTLALPLLFTIGACFVPLREIAANPVVKNTAGQQATAELENMLEALEEAEILEAKEEQTLRDAIEKLQEETADSPLTHEKWETVDALEQRMRMQLEEASVGVAQAAQAAAILAKAGDGEAGELSAERMAELEGDLLETLRKMAENGNLSAGAGKMGLSKSDLERLMKSGQLGLPKDPTERQELLNKLSDFLQEEADKLSELRGECEGSMCQNCGQECEGGQCQACAGNKAGRGGVNRGRGDAEMAWGDESDDAGIKFKESVLPPGMQEDPKEEIIGLTKSEPEVDPAKGISRQAARADDPAAGRETWNRKLRPRHRGTVRRFFDSVSQ